MGRKRDEIYGAALVVPFPESKSVSPSQSGAAGFCIPNIQINAAADVVTDNGALRAPCLHRYAMRVSKNTIHSKGLRVISCRRLREDDAMQKQSVAKLSAGARTQSIVGNQLRFHLPRCVFNPTKDLSRRITHHCVAAMCEAAKTVFVIAKMNRGRLKLPQERQPREEIVGHAFGVIRIVGVPPCSCPEGGHIDKIAKVQNGLRSVSLAEFQHCPGGP